MASLLVRNLEQSIVDELKKKAVEHGQSAEAEHRNILQNYLLPLKKKTFAQILSQMPNVGRDEDFERINDTHRQDDVFT